MTHDLTFFTNEADATLLDRFKATLKDVQYFDVLVGYFRSSGFHLLYDALENAARKHKSTIHCCPQPSEAKVLISSTTTLIP